MKSILLEASFIPGAVCRGHNPVCVLVDAIRASCTIVALLEKNYKKIYLIDDEAALTAEDRNCLGTGAIVCAEKIEGTKSDSADVSPSLIDIAKITDGGGASVLFRTTNGTRGVQTLRAMGLHEIYIGALPNREAVAKAAVERAFELQTGVCVVGAGREGGRVYCIDDVYASSLILISMRDHAQKRGYAVHVQDSAKIAFALAAAYASADEAFEKSASGAIMRQAGSAGDIGLCARQNISRLVPKVSDPGSRGRLEIEAV